MSYISPTPFRLAVGILLTSITCALAQTATTDPVGFTTASLPAGSASTRVSCAVSFPLYRPAVYNAAVSAVSTTTVDLSGGNFGTGGGQTDVLTIPHLVRVKSATDTTHIGRFFLIGAQSASQLTVVGTSSLSSFISVGDTCEVLPANTLGSVFGTSSVVAGWKTGATPSSADKLLIWNRGTSAWDTYFHDGVNWMSTSSGNPQNNAIIYPDEGVFISRVGTSAVSLITTGTVPTTGERTDLDGAGATFISNRFPVDIQLGAIGFEKAAGWLSGATPSSADKVLFWNNSSWVTYFYDGTHWMSTSSGSIQDSTVIPAGVALFIVRKGASDTTLAQNLPYTL